jgi:hypothetical protein
MVLSHRGGGPELALLEAQLLYRGLGMLLLESILCNLRGSIEIIEQYIG